MVLYTKLKLVFSATIWYIILWNLPEFRLRKSRKTTFKTPQNLKTYRDFVLDLVRQILDSRRQRVFDFILEFKYSTIQHFLSITINPQTKNIPEDRWWRPEFCLLFHLALGWCRSILPHWTGREERRTKRDFWLNLI